MKNLKIKVVAAMLLISMILVFCCSCGGTSEGVVETTLKKAKTLDLTVEIAANASGMRDFSLNILKAENVVNIIEDNKKIASIIINNDLYTVIDYNNNSINDASTILAAINGNEMLKLYYSVASAVLNGTEGYVCFYDLLGETVKVSVEKISTEKGIISKFKLRCDFQDQGVYAKSDVYVYES